MFREEIGGQSGFRNSIQAYALYPRYAAFRRLYWYPIALIEHYGTVLIFSKVVLEAFVRSFVQFLKRDFAILYPQAHFCCLRPLTLKNILYTQPLLLPNAVVWKASRSKYRALC
jgi:hypothetical protein